MNIVRKLLTQRDEQTGSQPNTDHSLSLMHLNKLFNELKLSSGQLINGPAVGVGGISKYDHQAHQAIAEYEQKVYRLLPLFLKVRRVLILYLYSLARCTRTLLNS